MKNIFNTILCVSILATTVSTLTSCKKEEDEGKLPNISLKTGGDYTSANTTVEKNKSVKFGISASKAEEKDPLTKLTITRSVNGGADSVMYTETLSGTSGDSYSKDYTTTTRNEAGAEKYTFTVVNKDGLINNTSVTLTVQ